jgi:hypothetical protein
MKKIFPIILLFIALFNINTAYSQIGLTLTGGVQSPTKDFASIVKNGYGFCASIDYSIPLVPVEISFSAGYNNWAYKTQFEPANTGQQGVGNGINYYAIPVTVGPRLFIPISIFIFRPYIGVDAGIAYSSSTASGALSTRDFIYSPMFGFRLSLPPGIIAIDINFKNYNYTDSGHTFSWIGINGGLSIAL